MNQERNLRHFLFMELFFASSMAKPPQSAMSWNKWVPKAASKWVS